MFELTHLRMGVFASIILQIKEWLKAFNFIRKFDYGVALISEYVFRVRTLLIISIHLKICPLNACWAILSL